MNNNSDTLPADKDVSDDDQPMYGSVAIGPLMMDRDLEMQKQAVLKKYFGNKYSSSTATMNWVNNCPSDADTNGIHVEVNDETMTSHCDENNDNNHEMYDNMSANVAINGDINDNNDDNMNGGDLIIDETNHSTGDIELEVEGPPDIDTIGSLFDVNDKWLKDYSQHKRDHNERPEILLVYIYARDVTKYEVMFKDNSVEVRYITKANPEDICVWRQTLFGSIKPEECSHKLNPYKIELTLKKVDTKFMWNTLEKSNNLLNTSGNFKKVDIGTHSSANMQLVLVPNNSDNNNQPSVQSKLVGFTGLQNLGNTCFMNSVVQCLSNTDPFRDYFVSKSYIPDINTSNPFGSGGVICKTFADVLARLWAGTDHSIAPHKLKEKMGEKCPTFSNYMQQDAQEFCAYLLDVLHEDLNRRRERPVIKDNKSSDDDDDESDEPIDDRIMADQSWHTYGLLNDSIVTQQFYGQYKSKLVCPTCAKVSVTFDPFVYLSLPLPKPKVEYEVYFYKRDLNGMSTSKPTKYTLKLAKECVVKNLMDEISKITGVSISALRCIQCTNDGSIEKFLQPNWTLSKPDVNKYLLVFELMAPNEANDDVTEFVVVQRLSKPVISDNCAKCDKNMAWEGTDLAIVCNDCQRVSYCDEQCQTDHRTAHCKDCVYKPQTMATPFVITIPKAQLTYRNLWTVIYSYARHSVRLANPLNLNEFPTPPPFKLKVYRDWKKEDTGELIEPNVDIDGNDTDPQIYDQLINVENYYMTMDWINCKTFGHNWVRVEPQMGISCITDYLHKNDNNEVINLEDCLQLHTKPETLTSDNPWYCPKCKEQRQATKQITLWRLPQILVIQLKRFSFRNILWREKLDSMVRYPIRGLDMSQYYVRTDNNPDSPPVYDLYGVVNHYGGLFGGHYTAIAKTSNNYKNLGWRCFDDSRVESVGEESVVTKAAYMLFYKLRDN